jgi:hypothetical protein
MSRHLGSFGPRGSLREAQVFRSSITIKKLESKKILSPFKFLKVPESEKYEK